MNTKKLNEYAYDYILDCIATEEYGETPKTNTEKLQFLYNTFSNEKAYEIKRKGLYLAFSDWCRGLPTAFNIAYWDDDIIDLAIAWGSIQKTASENTKQKIISNYWNFITNKTFNLFVKHNIKEPIK